MENTTNKRYRVLVLLATYNGERYLKEQLDSILSQKGVDITILVGDDCSMDKTIDILKEASIKDRRVKYRVNQKNLGYSKNFMNLIQEVPLYKYDYICLSDQDDFWLEEKVISAINKIKDEQDNIPCLYSSNLTVVNEKLKVIKTMYSSKVDVDNALESYCTGCTVLFNNSLLALVKKYPMDKVDLPHDYIIKNIAQLCGRYVYDPESYILYRQHSLNQIGVNDTGKFQKRVRKFFKPSDHHYSNLYRHLRENYKLAILNKYEGVSFTVANYRNNLKCYLKLLFTNKYRKKTLADNIAFKIAIMFRKY